MHWRRRMEKKKSLKKIATHSINLVSFSAYDCHLHNEMCLVPLFRSRMCITSRRQFRKVYITAADIITAPRCAMSMCTQRCTRNTDRAYTVLEIRTISVRSRHRHYISHFTSKAHPPSGYCHSSRVEPKHFQPETVIRFLSFLRCQQHRASNGEEDKKKIEIKTERNHVR